MEGSPSSTPSPSFLATEQGRFKAMTTPCEWVESYRPGGYLPVHFGDVLSDGRYKVIRKLGVGAYSTVWAAHDLLRDSVVAVKILKANITQTSNELEILQHLSSSGDPAIKDAIVELLDHFLHKDGPNGEHICLVFELMGPTVYTMLENLPQFKKYRKDVIVRYPVWMAKQILRETCKALVCLHRQGIAHGDLQPGNMLFSLRPTTELRGGRGGNHSPHQIASEGITAKVERKDGKDDKWAPSYLAVSQPLVELADTNPGFTTKLSDFGGAYRINDPPKKPITPHGLRAPELVVKGEVNHTGDIWAFGCLVFELITGHPLYYIDCYDDIEDEKDNHLLMMSDTLGPLPDELYALWPRSSRYYTAERVQYNTLLFDDPEETNRLANKMKNVEDLFDEKKPDDISEEESIKIKMLIRRILQYDPAKRPSASEVLQDAWFTD